MREGGDDWHTLRPYLLPRVEAIKVGRAVAGRLPFGADRGRWVRPRLVCMRGCANYRTNGRKLSRLRGAGCDGTGAVFVSVPSTLKKETRKQPREGRGRKLSPPRKRRVHATGTVSVSVHQLVKWLTVNGEHAPSRDESYHPPNRKLSRTGRFFLRAITAEQRL